MTTDTTLSPPQTKRSIAFDAFRELLKQAIRDPDVWVPISHAATNYADAAARDAIADTMTFLRDAP